MVVCITGVCRQTFPTPIFIDLPWLPVIFFGPNGGRFRQVLLYMY
jgi:hypothetical protein